MTQRKVPEPTYDYEAKKILKYYMTAREEVIKNLLLLVENSGDPLKVSIQASMLRQIDFIIAELNGVVQTTLEEGLLASFKEGQAVLRYSTGDYKTLGEASEGVSFSQLSKATIDAIIADTLDDLLAATQLTSKRTKAIVRRVVAEQMKVAMAQASGRKIMNKGIITELTKQGLSTSVKADGFVGIVDKLGRKWELNRYVDMVVRTKYKQARIEGLRIQALEEGFDLARISSHGAKDACSYYEGVVISLNGTTRGYISYDELRRGSKIFHPNCKHSVYPLRRDEIDEDEQSEE